MLHELHSVRKGPSTSRDKLLPMTMSMCTTHSLAFRMRWPFFFCRHCGHLGLARRH